MRTTYINGERSRPRPSSLGNRARPVASVAWEKRVAPFLPMTSTVAPATGVPVWIDWTKASWLPSSAFLTRMPRSVTSTSRLSVHCPGSVAPGDAVSSSVSPSFSSSPSAARGAERAGFPFRSAEGS